MDATMDKLSLKEQNGILQECIEKDLPLADKLSQKGLTYDSLRYIEYADSYPEKDNYQSIDDVERFEPTIPAVSFFSGGGGLDIGFEYAGFNNLAAVEINRVFCDTLRLNHHKQ